MPPRFARIRHLQITLKYLTLNQKKAAQPVGYVAFRGVCMHLIDSAGPPTQSLYDAGCSPRGLNQFHHIPIYPTSRHQG